MAEVKKKVIKKVTSQSSSSSKLSSDNTKVDVVNTNTIGQDITSSILDNDYRSILSKYDISKNTSRPIITIYERSLLIGKRATQIAYGASPLITVEPGMNEVAIAEEELKQRRIPLIIKRTIGDYTEYWKPADMILP